MIYTINPSFFKPNITNVYYNSYNKVYYHSKYVDNYILTESLIDPLHEDNRYGDDLSANKRLFSNNKTYRITYYG